MCAWRVACILRDYKAVTLACLESRLVCLLPVTRTTSEISHGLYNIHSRFSGSLNLALFSFHITIIITVSLITSHFICFTAYYCSIVSENKPPSSFHSCLVGFYRHSKSPHSSSLLFSHLISSYVNICCHSHFIFRENRYRYSYRISTWAF